MSSPPVTPAPRLTPPPLAGGEPPAPVSPWLQGRTPVTAGAVAALQAACVTLVVALVPAVAAWVAATDSDLPWTSAARTALQAWLLAHHTALLLPSGGSLSLVPLGLAVLAPLSCWYAGRRLAGAVDPRLERVMAGRARPSAPPARALVSFVGCYTSLAFLAALLATTPSVRPIPGQAALGGLAVSTVGVCVGAAGYVAGGVRRGLRLTAEVLQVPQRVRAWVAGATAAVGVQLLAGAVLLVVGLVRGREAALAVLHALDPGTVGSLAMAALQLAYVPDGAVWGAAFATGPGFAVGTDTFVTPAASSLGALPAIPVFAALPPTGSRHPALLAVLACGFLAGAIGGAIAARSRRRLGVPPRLLPAVVDSLGLGAVAAVGMLALTWAATGSIGPGRLAQAGPQPLVTGGVFGGEVAAGALLLAGAAALVRVLRGRAQAGAGGSGTAAADTSASPGSPREAGASGGASDSSTGSSAAATSDAEPSAAGVSDPA